VYQSFTRAVDAQQGQRNHYVDKKHDKTLAILAFPLAMSVNSTAMT